MLFRHLNVGDTFDFIADDRPTTFFARCTKVSPLKYTYDGVRPDVTARIGSINCHVWHVEKAATYRTQLASDIRQTLDLGK